MRGTKWAVGVAGAAGLVGGAVLAAPTGASAVVGPQIRAGQAVIGAGNALGNEEQVPHYPLVVASRDSTDGGMRIWADGNYPTVNATSYGPSAAAWMVATAPGVTALRGSAMGSGGRGASFEGDAAQVQLTPATTTHPKSGRRGDLFVDKDGKLWFCKGGTTWRQLA